MNTRIGIVTVTYNSALLLDDFLRSMDAQDHADWHCWIIDNDSRDGTVSNLQARGLDPSRYTVVDNRKNVGVAAGNNQGILLALEQGCDWVLLINNDTVFPRGLLSHLLATAQSRQWHAIVPKIHFNIPAGAIWYGGGGFDPRKGYTGFHAGIGQPDTGQLDQVQTVDYSPTCCMLIDRTAFEAVGLMDESYFAYFDDTDFCWRLKQQDIALGYAPEQVLIHKVGGSTGGTASPFFASTSGEARRCAGSWCSCPTTCSATC
jgi:GT2 family glycosyltransferase